MKFAGPALAGLLLAPLLLVSGLLAAQTKPDAGETPSSVETTDGQAAAPAEILEAFSRLAGRAETRQLFGLPKDTFWRRSSELDIALLADDWQELGPVLEGTVAPFAAASGLEISVIESGPAGIAGKDPAALAPEAELVFILAPRSDIADFAVANGFNLGMLARFEMGTLPFIFAFEDDNRRRGVVLLADDESDRAREASFILATVWGLGGVTLGPELTGLVSDSEEGPSLTPLGQAVFSLFYHHDLEVGMPLGDAVQRAETLLPQ
jgi:hypothetical protein